MHSKQAKKDNLQDTFYLPLPPLLYNLSACQCEAWAAHWAYAWSWNSSLCAIRRETSNKEFYYKVFKMFLNLSNLWSMVSGAFGQAGNNHVRIA